MTYTSTPEDCALFDATKARNKIIRERDAELHRRTKVIEKQVADEFKDRIDAANRAVDEAGAARYAVAIQAAASQTLLGHQPGTVLYEWDAPDRYRHNKWRRTKRSAQVTIATHEVIAELASNRYKPEAGKLFLRLLKADGTPSAQFVSTVFDNAWHLSPTEPPPVFTLGSRTRAPNEAQS